MGIFGKKKASVDDEKLPNGEVHDPILNAVREMQPWEQAGNEHNETISPTAARDAFGAPITNPDMSNPSRSREERPLDTIRSFEYQATGDERLKDMGETQRFGFRPRPDFVAMPSFAENPYAPESNVIALGDPNVQPEPRKEAYYPDQPTPVRNMKKKGGLFRKKKKD